jgi:antitoxin ChpS
MAIPKRLLEMVDLRAGSQVDVNVQNGRLIVVPQKKKRYKLSELLAQCDPTQPLSQEELDWVNAPAMGQEDGAGH